MPKGLQTSKFFNRDILSRHKPAKDKKPAGEGGRNTFTVCSGTCTAAIVLYRHRQVRDGVVHLGPWTVQHQRNTHSHPVGKDETVLRATLDGSTKEELLWQYTNGVSAATLARLAQSKQSGYVTLTEVTNLIHKDKEEYMAGRTDSAVTIRQCETAGLPHKVSKQKVVGVFII